MKTSRISFFNQAITISLVSILLFAMGCATMQSQGSPEADKTESPQPLRVGMTPNYPPLIFMENGKISGIEADLAEALSKELNTPFVFVEKPFPDLVSALVTHEIDMIMSGMSVTAKREALVRFVQPYMHVGQIAIIRKVDQARFDPPKDALYVNGLRVGYERGTSGMQFAVDNLLLAQLEKFDSAEAGLAALLAGGVDVFIHDTPTAWSISTDKSYADLMVLTVPLTREPVAWAVRKEETELASRMNAVLDAWKEDGRLEKILDHWLPVSLQTE